MSSFDAHRHISAAQIEANAFEEEVTIHPSYTQTVALSGIEANYKLFRAGMPTQVPLWMALHLRETSRARIDCPHWMELASLDARLAEERLPANAQVLSTLPPHYMEMAEAMFKFARDDLGPDADRILDVLLEIQDCRAQKLKRGTDSVLAASKEGGAMDNLVVPVLNLGTAELSALQHGFLKALGVISELSAAQAVSDLRGSELGPGRGSQSLSIGASSRSSERVALDQDEQPAGGANLALRMQRLIASRIEKSRAARRQAETGEDEPGASEGDASNSNFGSEAS